MLSVLFERGTRLDVKRISQVGGPDLAHLELWNRVLIDYVQPEPMALGALVLELAGMLPLEELADVGIGFEKLVAQRVHDARAAAAGPAQGGQPTSS